MYIENGKKEAENIRKQGYPVTEQVAQNFPTIVLKNTTIFFSNSSSFFRGVIKVP